MLNTGDIISGYRITQRIAEDDRFVLCAAERDGRPFCLKLLREEQARNPGVVERFKRAAELLRKISPTGMVVIRDSGEYGRLPFIITDRMEGAALRSVLSQLGPAAAPSEILSGLIQLAQTLAALHRNQCLYLRLNPDQILWTPGEPARPTRVLLLDSDTACSIAGPAPRLPTIADSEITDHCAEVHYLGPEFFGEEGAIGDRSDVYALGALAYLVLTGRPPFIGKRSGAVINGHLREPPPPLRSLHATLPQDLERLLASMLDKQPDRRPDSSRVESELARLLPGGTLVLAPTAAMQRYGDYQLGDRIAEGGMSVVYEATSERLGRHAAIKVLNDSLSRRPEIVARFLDEVRCANLIGHPGIISIFCADRTESGQPYIVMERLHGVTLRSYLSTRCPMPAVEVCRIGWQLADALTAAHEKGIIHRDLKPENVMLVKDAAVTDGTRVKILDFGIAKLRTEERREVLTQHGAVLGSPPYMSPEQREDAAQVNEATDVYSLGLMLREMRGQSAHPGAEVPPGPAELVSLIQAMLSKEPSQRPTMAAVRDALQLMTGGAPFNAASQGPRPRIAQRVALLSMGGAVILGGALWATGTISPVACGNYDAQPADQRTLEPLPDLARYPNPRNMVAFAGGEFAMGSATVTARPMRKVVIRPFAIDITEVTNEQFAEWLNSQKLLVDAKRFVRRESVLLADLYQPSSGIRYDIRSARFVVNEDAERKPVVQVSWLAAEQFCQTQGKRLPTENEWELAATGVPTDQVPQKRRFPWGDTPRGCADVVFGRMAQGECAAFGSGPVEVGSAPGDRTPEGVRDLGGNVAEWVASDAISQRSMRVMRGGDWARGNMSTTTAARSGTELAMDSMLPNLGFRCGKTLGN